MSGSFGFSRLQRLQNRLFPRSDSVGPQGPTRVLGDVVPAWDYLRPRMGTGFELKAAEATAAADGAADFPDPPSGFINIPVFVQFRVDGVAGNAVTMRADLLNVTSSVEPDQWGPWGIGDVEAILGPTSITIPVGQTFTVQNFSWAVAVPLWWPRGNRFRFVAAGLTGTGWTATMFWYEMSGELWSGAFL